MKKKNIGILKILIIALCSLTLSACGDDSDSNNTSESVVENDGISASDPGFLSVCNTDNGDLIITITDDAVAERINPDDHIDDWYNYYEDQVYDIIFYANEQMGIDSTYCEDCGRSSIARLCVYGCGASIGDYVYDRLDGAWEYQADWKNKCFSVDGETLTLFFSGAGNVLNDSKAYVCQYQDQNGDWMTVSQTTMSVEVGSDAVVTLASSSNDYLNIGFIDDDTVYVTVYDDELTADSDVADYQVLFCEKEFDIHYDTNGNLVTFGIYELTSRYNDGNTYLISTIRENRWIEETDTGDSYYVEVMLDYDRGNSEYDLEHSDRENITSADPSGWYGDAEIYDGFITMKFKHEDIKSSLAQFEYVCVVKGLGESKELIGQFRFDDVASLEDYDPYPAESIEPLHEEYVRPYDAGIFEPETPYYSVLSSEIYGPVANGMVWQQIKTGSMIYTEPPFPYAWGFHPEIDTERNGHAISTMLESYDEFGELVQSVLRIEYDSVEDLQWSYIPWNCIYYPYNEYGVDEPSMEYVNPEWYETMRELTIKENSMDAVCLGIYENYVYYDLMGIYWSLDRYGCCFDRHLKTAEFENYYSDGSSMTYTESVPAPFISAVELRGNVDQNMEDGTFWNNSSEIRTDLNLNGSIHYVPDTIDGQGAAFVHDTTCKIDDIGGYMGLVYGDTPTGLMRGYSYVGNIRRIYDMAPER